MNIYVNASNIHIGGGKTILTDLINAAKYFRTINFIIFIYSRFVIPYYIHKKIVFNKVRRDKRFVVCFVIERRTTTNDIVLYLTNIPPIIKHKCKTFLVQSNRFVIDGFKLSGFPIITKLRICSERLLFWINNNNTDYIIVQS